MRNAARFRLLRACCDSPAADTLFMTPCPGFVRRSDGLCEIHRSESEPPPPQKKIAEKKPFPFNSLPLCFLRTHHVSRLFPLTQLSPS